MLVKYLSLAVCIAGCATVTRESNVPANGAAKLPAHSQLIAVNGAPVSGATLAVEGDAVLLVTAQRRVPLSSSDVLTVRATYRDGDTIPNEGLVRARPSAGLILAGSFMLGGGIAGAAFTAWEVGLFTNNVSSSPGGMAFIVVNGVIAAAGIALVVLGALPHAHVINPYLALAPGLTLGVQSDGLIISF